MIDWNRVTELREEVGEEDFQDVVDMFLDEVSEELETLTSIQGAQEFEEKLHFLKGAALNLGLSAFADLCKTGEEMARAGHTDGIEPAQIITCYQRSIDEFSRIINDTAAA